MDARPDRPLPRRELLRRAALAAMAHPLSASRSHASAEPPPKTHRIRLIRIGGICLAPQYVAEELLRAEGFTDVQYLSKTLSEDVHRALAVGEADISMWFVAPLLREIEAGNPLVMLAGIHPGCHELFGNRGFVRGHPVATKRALRALLKASLMCATEPERVARTLVERGFAQSYDYALQTLRDLPYGRWREYEAEDSA